jgi:DsbC/DsbD-like thiol-disulfide interchange protein
MKTLLILLSTFLCSIGMLQAQAPSPVKWSASYEKVNDKEGFIHIKADIDKGWHTYSQRPTDAGPIPSSFTFTPSKGYELIGKTEEEGAHEEFVKAFDAKIFVFTGTALFKQKINLKSKGKQTIALKVEYMCCDDMMCLPPKTLELSVTVGN